MAGATNFFAGKSSVGQKTYVETTFDGETTEKLDPKEKIDFAIIPENILSSPVASFSFNIFVAGKTSVSQPTHFKKFPTKETE